MDPDAARIWATRGGAKAYFVPEPPIAAPRPTAREPIFDYVLFGFLDPRKGLAFVERALTLDSMPNRLRLAIGGPVEPSYRSALAAQIRAMRNTGVDVELSLRNHSEYETIELLAAARWALLPYVEHYGMSRVLFEAAYAGTPILSHDRGLIGKLVRENGLGVTVDCEDPGELRQTILRLAGRRGVEYQYSDRLRAFADRHSEDRFAENVSAPYG
jgi:glycosyltransferase involved in cell wall biosynthesis